MMIDHVTRIQYAGCANVISIHTSMRLTARQVLHVRFTPDMHLITICTSLWYAFYLTIFT